MKKIYPQILIILMVSLFSLSVHAQKLTTYVTDDANIIPVDAQAALETRLAAFEASTTNQIVVVTIPELPANETIETMAYKIFQENGIGQKDKNNGLLFLIALKDKKFRFETGYGLEPILPDVYTGRLQREVLAPAFRAGDYPGGIIQSIDQIINRINSGEVYVDTNAAKKANPNGGDLYGLLIFAIIVLGQVILNIFSKSKSYWAGGVVGLAAGLLVYIFTGFVIAFGLTIVGLLLDMFASKHPGMFKNRGRGGWGGMGGFGGGSSGGGGFSGGSGSSGGGGSSGGW